ncbi:hypothetical protein COH21_012640, partial [Aspergillus flavus]
MADPLEKEKRLAAILSLDGILQDALVNIAQSMRDILQLVASLIHRFTVSSLAFNQGHDKMHPLEEPTALCNDIRLPEAQFIQLTKATDLVPESTVENVYNQLKPVPPSFLIGKWNGGDIDTGHIGHKLLKEMKWAGKDFRSVDDGDPIMVHDAEGNRVWKEDWGHCS